MNIQVKSSSAVNPTTPVSIRCPLCRQNGVFRAVNVNDIEIQTDNNHFIAGQRICPDAKCKNHIFFISQGDNVLITYPTERIDFDSTNIPTGVLSALNEAIICYANQCYIAAAIMVRKTLEELCTEQKAKGENLKKRLATLGTKSIVSNELLDGLDNLRLLGNDAAHIELKDYEEIGSGQLELAIDITKEVLKVVYQHKGLVDRLEKYKVSK